MIQKDQSESIIYQRYQSKMHIYKAWGEDAEKCFKEHIFNFGGKADFTDGNHFRDYMRKQVFMDMAFHGYEPNTKKRNQVRKDAYQLIYKISKIVRIWNDQE